MTASSPSSWPSTIKAVLFDLDGTLADTAPDLAGALNRMRIIRGLAPMPLAVLRPVASAGARGLLQAGLGLRPEHEAYEATRLEFLEQYEAGLVLESRLFGGVVELLSSLAQRDLRWGVVTNKASRFTTPVLRGLGLDAAVVISGDTTPHAKPHPEPLLEACRRMDLSPRQAIYVGDDLRDAQSAQAAGMPFLAAAYGYLGEGLPIEQWGADAIVSSPMEILQFVA